jgi:Fe-S oxidoreductase
VNVDMATYKAEFLSHYYEGRLRPRHAYAFGLIHGWARLASVAPGLANIATQLPGLSAVSKWMAGAHQARRIPAFAPQSFTRWFHRRRARPGANGHAGHGKPRPEVLLFPDTFNNHFHPDVAKSATRVIERAGFDVRIPKGDVCCGRPLYDYGFLDQAKRRWVKTLAKLRPFVQADVPVVVLEPSCYSAFKDELGNLLPNDQDAKRLGRLVMTMSEFVQHRAPDFALPHLEREALLHGHCHQKALDVRNDKELGKLFAEKAVLERLAIRPREPETGCCGMAGAFGYEKGNDHYDVSVACGERVLLPEVRRSVPEALILADGFSCQEQIEQTTERSALHIAQLLDMATGSGLPPKRPESPAMAARQRAVRASLKRAGLGMAIVAAVGTVGVWWLRKPNNGKNKRRARRWL